jgi:enamine deaminase RidA (YjgF/YER057c/UK114 family)
LRNAHAATCRTWGFPSLLATLFHAMSLYPGTPYNYSAIAQGLVFTAGACPLDEHGTIVAPGDLEAQALQAAENLLAALSIHDVGPESLLKTTVFVVARDRSDLVRVWDVVSPRLGRAPSTLLGVSLLGYPDQLVEIEAVAAIESSSAASG